MKKMILKGISALVVVIMVFSCFSVSAFAATEDEDLTGFGVKDMSYAEAVVAVPAMNKVFDAANLLAGATESWSSADGTVYKDISYGARGCQKYDMYIPSNLDTSKPQGLVVSIHGGTWTMGDKSCMAWSCKRFAKAGYITMTMNYDLASQGNDNVAKVTGSKSNANVYDMVEDVLLAIASAKKEAANHGYTLESVALMGESAGSNIAALTAYGQGSNSALPVKCLFAVTLPAGFHKGDIDIYTNEKVAGYASIVSGEKLTEEDILNPDERAQKILDSISPDAQVTESSCPTLLGFAGKDTVIGTNQYNVIHAPLEKYNVTHDVIWWPNSNHTLESDPGVLRTYTDTAIEWLDKYMHSSVSEEKETTAAQNEMSPEEENDTPESTDNNASDATEKEETMTEKEEAFSTSKGDSLAYTGDHGYGGIAALAIASGAAFIVAYRKKNS